jgi:hypothetical protein
MSARSIRVATVLLILVVATAHTAQTALAYTLMNDGYYRKSYGINTSTYASSYATPINGAISSWNSAGVGVSVTGGSAPYANIMYAQSVADSYYGAYIPQVRNAAYYPHQTTQFKVIINTRTCSSLSATAKRSVVCHELGHSWGLNHEPIKTAIMNSGRLRDVIYTPQLDDRNGVVASWNR